MKLSQGDAVVVITGKDKGKRGTVLRVLLDQSRVIVGGINMVTKHVKKTAQSAGRKVQFEHSIHSSNVAIVDPKTGKPTRTAYRIDEKTHRKVRVSKKSGTVLERVRIEADAKETGVKSTEAAPKKASKSKFWSKVGFGSDVAAESAKTEAGPAQTAVTHRSAGRGS